jgi:hypothetical protein
VARLGPRGPDAVLAQGVDPLAVPAQLVEPAAAPAVALAVSSVGVQEHAAPMFRSHAVSFGLTFKKAELCPLRSRFLLQQPSLLRSSASGGPSIPCRREFSDQRTHIPLERWAQRAVVESRCRVIEREEGRAERKPHPTIQRVPVDCGDLRVWGEGSEGVPAERSDHHWAQKSKLALQERCAGCDLLRCWVTVLRWAALHHIEYEYILSRTPSEPEEEIEKPSGCPNERSTHRILTRTRSLSDKEQLGARAPLAWDAASSR